MLGRMEDGKVVPLGDLYDERFMFALGCKVRCQLKAQKSRLRADNGIFAGVIARHAMEDINADLLLCGFLRSIPQAAIHYIQEELAQLRRSTEVRAGDDPVRQRGTWVIQSVERFI